MNIPFNKVKKKQIIERYVKGERVVELAKEYGVSIQAIYAWTNGVRKDRPYTPVTRQAPKFTEITDEEIKKFKAQQDGSLMLRYNDTKYYNNNNRDIE